MTSTRLLTLFLKHNTEYLEEKTGFVPAPRRTEADKTGQNDTHNRKLDERLYLVLPNHHHTKGKGWNLPRTFLKEDETFLQAAQRIVPPGIKVYCPSFCPVACDVWNVKNPPPGKFGTKTFFMKVALDEGHPDYPPNIVTTEHAWLSKDELTEHMKERFGWGAQRFYHYML